MGKLSGEALKFIATHLVEASKHPTNKRYLLIVADNQENAKKIATWVKGPFGAKKIVSGLIGGLGKKISLSFEYVYQRDDAVKQINAEVDSYRLSHPDIIAPEPTEAPAAGGTPEPGQPEKGTVDWTTYIIIGVAAVALVLLIWPAKKR